MEPLRLSVPLPDVLHEVDGDIRVKGHRISLYHIIAAANKHWISPEAMVFYYPTLSYDEIQEVFAFYQANRVVVDAYVRECDARMEAVMATVKRVPIEEYRRRFEAMRAKSAEVNGTVHPSPTEAPHTPED